MVVKFASGGHHVLKHNDWWVVVDSESLWLEVTETHVCSVFAHLVNGLNERRVQHL